MLSTCVISSSVVVCVLGKWRETMCCLLVGYLLPELFVIWANREKQRVVYLAVVFRSCWCFGLMERNKVLSNCGISSSRVVCVLG